MTLTFSHNHKFANFWLRLIAYFIDMLILGSYFPLLLMYLAKAPSLSTVMTQTVIAITLIILPLELFRFIYFIEAVHRYGQTLGQKVMGVRVLTQDGSYLSRKRSAFRQFLAKPISFFSVVGILAIFTHPNHQAWHDQLAGSFVHKQSSRLARGVMIMVLLFVLHGVLIAQAFSSFNQNQPLSTELKQEAQLIQQQIRNAVIQGQADSAKKLAATQSSSSSTTSAKPSPKNLPAIPAESTQKWLIGASGILALRNQENLASLSTHESKPVLDSLLTESWGVKDHDTAIQTLDWLKTEGHRSEFAKLRQYLVDNTDDNEEKYKALRSQFVTALHLETPKASGYVLDFVWLHRHDLASKELLAWDYGRLMNVARWSYSAGYINQEEAWQYMRDAGLKLQQTYNSWDEFGQNYLLGRTFWQHSSSQPEMQSSEKWLETNPKSPWKTLPWEISLEE